MARKVSKPVTRARDGEFGVWVGDEVFSELAEKFAMRCRICTEFVTVDELEIFLDREMCSSCADADDRWARE